MIKRLFFSILLITIAALSYSLLLRVFYTNDSHGAYLPRSYVTPEGRISLGGYAALEYHLNQRRAEFPRSVYFDAGDQQTGSVFSSLERNGAVGGAIPEVFNLLGLAAAALGNHEFDYSYANTKRLIELANYPFLSTNIIDHQTDDHLSPHPYTIIELDSLHIGVMGLTMIDLRERVKAANVRDLTLLPYVLSLDRYLDHLAARTDLIFILSHLGFEADSLLATKLDNRVSMIIGGHSHTPLPEPTVVNDILILQAGAYLTCLGQLDILIEAGRILGWENELIPVTTPEQMPETPLNRLVNQISERIDLELNRVIGIMPFDSTPSKYELTDISRWMADALRAEYFDRYQPDLAMLNCGGIRKAIPKGEITLKDLTEMLPFNNTVVLFTATGTDLISFYNHNQRNMIDPPHDIVQDSGISRMGNSENYLINGVPLDQKDIYRIVSHDFLAGQWEKYLTFKPQSVIDTGDLILDAVKNQIVRQFSPQQ
ncbi:MAG: bifunctional metallophosphatase/5'-nucleotidase [Candidatus Cloacimonetes bacterium]|nr:bifunctional metallophosphatase/5'-nucleotidase [Candidatus Cloacimonadota bacterium]